MSKKFKPQPAKAEVTVAQEVTVPEAPKAAPRELSSTLVAWCQETRFPKLHPSNLKVYNMILELDKAIKA